MSTIREATFDTTTCRIYIRKHVDPISSARFPWVATAFVGDDEVAEADEPVEVMAGTDDQAIEVMSDYLQRRYRAALVVNRPPLLL
jgi:hypothetical protein